MEFQAVILAAGVGTRFRDVVASRPKCLLPVGPYPLIFYPLNFCSSYGFEEVIIIVLESQKNEIAQRVAKLPLKLKYDFVCFNQEDDFGTADALRLVADRVKLDVIVMSCDIITNIDFYPVLNQFRQNDASCVALFDNLEEKQEKGRIVVPGPKEYHTAERDLVGIENTNNRLLLLTSTTDFQDNIVDLPGHLLRSYGKMTIYSNLTDVHLYLVKNWVVKWLAKKERITTIKGELLPYIIKKQLTRPAANTKSLNVSEVNFDTNSVYDHIQHTDLYKKIQETNLSHTAAHHKKSKSTEIIKCYAYIAPQNSFCIRINTILNYYLINRQIPVLFADYFKLPLVSKSATIKSTQIADCSVADNTTIAEKTSIKNTVFGVGCNIEQRTRINDSILMTNVTVEEGVVLENCIICDKAVIKTGCVLKNCLIGHNFVVKENTSKNRVHLTGESFMEI